VWQFYGCTQLSSCSLAFARGPFGLDFNSSLDACGVMEKTAPGPVFGTLAESRPYRVPMDVMELLHELLMIANVEIVVALLPEMIGVSNQTPRYALLQGFEGIRQGVPFRFADQKVDVFRHDNVSIDAHAETAAHALKRALKHLSARAIREEGMAVVTTESNEMALSGVVIALETPWHEISVDCRNSPLKAKKALSGPPSFKVELSFCYSAP
jgi:hypothetical protein